MIVWLKWWCSMVDVLYTAAKGVCSFFIHELVRPLWSKSWQRQAKNNARACQTKQCFKTQTFHSNPLATDRVISGQYGTMQIMHYWIDLVFSFGSKWFLTFGKVMDQRIKPLFKLAINSRDASFWKFWPILLKLHTENLLTFREEIHCPFRYLPTTLSK